MLELSTASLAILLLAAFGTGVLHGAVGLAGGVVMAAVLAHFVGLKTAVPIMTCALLFSHGSRVFLFRKETAWSTAWFVLAFGLPTIVLGAWVFTRISETVVAFIFAVFLTASFPVKRWAKAHRINTSKPVLAVASSVWGMLAGNVIGPGFFLAPFLQGTGMNRLTFVGTIAIITLAMNAAKLIVFSSAQLMSTESYLLGILIGCATIPGNWLGKRILHHMTDGHHEWLVDLLTFLLIANFVYLAVTVNAS
ncbi:MAG: sulfite exporter TauE/SafE family protein [Gammaproteobacteria bacterium]